MCVCVCACVCVRVRIMEIVFGDCQQGRTLRRTAPSLRVHVTHLNVSCHTHRCCKREGVERINAQKQTSSHISLSSGSHHTFECVVSHTKVLQRRWKSPSCPQASTKISTLTLSSLYLSRWQFLRQFSRCATKGLGFPLKKPCILAIYTSRTLEIWKIVTGFVTEILTICPVLCSYPHTLLFSSWVGEGVWMGMCVFACNLCKRSQAHT